VISSASPEAERELIDGALLDAISSVTSDCGGSVDQVLELGAAAKPFCAAGRLVTASESERFEAGHPTESIQRRRVIIKVVN
jgi:hypothetical protein